jgi:predicted dienelactone hydrolase
MRRKVEMSSMPNSLLRLFAAAVTSAMALAPTWAQIAPHNTPVAPVARGSLPVACSNVAQDLEKIRSVSGGGLPSDFWEGKDNNGRLRYISQILAEPTAPSVIQYNAPVPDSGLYPQFRGQTQNFVAVICYPTTDDNRRADYRLPDDSASVPRMQRGNDKPIVRPAFVQCQPLCIDPLPPALAQRLAARPLIIYSHGLGGSPIGKGYIDILTEFASQGYVVAGIFHGDARFSRIRIEDLGGLASLLRDFDKFVEMELLRPVAIKSMVDVLLAHPDFGPAINPLQIGGFGASMGGQALANVLGARLTTSLGQACNATVTDPRIKAAVGYVPYMGQTFLPSFCSDQNGMESMSRPYLAIAGTTDTTAPIRVTQAAMNRAKDSRYLVELVDVPHEYLLEYRDDVFTWTLTFLDAYVKGDRAALARLYGMRSVNGGRQDNVLVSAQAQPNLQGLFVASNLNTREDGHGIAVSQKGRNAFATWYLYDNQGRPSWLVMPSGTWSADLTRYTGAVYQPSGSFFGQYDASRFNPGPAVGTFTFMIPPDHSAIGSVVALDYTTVPSGMLGSATTSKAFSRLAFARNTLPQAPVADDATDIWWGGTTQNGWGVSITQDRDTLFGAWYTYDSNGRATWYTMPGGVWEGTTYVAPAFAATGPGVIGNNQFDPTRVQARQVGTVRLEFSGGNAIRMVYDVDGQRGTHALSRLPF